MTGPRVTAAAGSAPHAVGHGAPHLELAEERMEREARAAGDRFVVIASHERTSAMRIHGGLAVDEIHVGRAA